METDPVNTLSFEDFIGNFILIEIGIGLISDGECFNSL